MKKWAMLASLVALVAASYHAVAGYNDNVRGIVTQVLTYPGKNYVLVALDTQPTTYAGCDPHYFAVEASGTVTLDQLKMIYARLLVAKTTRESIAIGFNNAGSDCAGEGYIRLYRAG